MVLPITSHDFGGTIGEVGAIRDTNGTWYPIVDSMGLALISSYSPEMVASGSDCDDVVVTNEWNAPPQFLVELPDGMPSFTITNQHVSACGEGSYSVAFNLGDLLLVSDDNVLGDAFWLVPRS